MQLTKNFKLEEFACNDGSTTPPEIVKNLRVLAKNLQVLRDYYGKPIRINSGYRSPSYNRKVGGARRSQHLLGKAGDIAIEGYRPVQVKAAIEKLIQQGKMHNGGIGQYSTFVHYDVRDKAARWNKI